MADRTSKELAKDIGNGWQILINLSDDGIVKMDTNIPDLELVLDTMIKSLYLLRNKQRGHKTGPNIN